ncbi:hypothetical protein DWB68_15305 [Galactobacter valiniphilus]|uniref:Uncharacterized protein n=1 Tax=Galactobacter valiniphilus TaxID=2676122 RepID=A0A399JA85_9MICC|nr:hypothetical protein [Galactobacter valiniphilus]RII40932.1 hypothetical protein DWB68_15305 [Galactobacter valiniphilus]
MKYSTPWTRLMAELLCRAAGHTAEPLSPAGHDTLHTLCAAPFGFTLEQDEMSQADWQALYEEPWSASWYGRTLTAESSETVSVQLAWSRASGVVVLTNDNGGDLTYALAEALHDLIELALDEADSLKFTTVLAEEEDAA